MRSGRDRVVVEPVTKVSGSQHHGHHTGRVYELVGALSMTLGRGRAARMIAELAVLTPHDRVVDVGCGPGAAVRVASRVAGTATGVDPSPIMLGLARCISAFRRSRGVGWVQGSAESLPLADAEATVIWSLSSVHHWSDLDAGLGEIMRVLASGGRVILVERLVRPGARGHARHGLTAAQADQLAAALSGAGLARTAVATKRVGRRTLVVIEGSSSAAPNA